MEDLREKIWFLIIVGIKLLALMAKIILPAIILYAAICYLKDRNKKKEAEAMKSFRETIYRETEDELNEIEKDLEKKQNFDWSKP